MPDASPKSDSTTTCSTSCRTDQSCDCSSPDKPRVFKLGLGFVALCVACCAIPTALIAFGVIGVTTGALLTTGLESALILLGLIGLGYFMRAYVRQRLKR